MSLTPRTTGTSLDQLVTDILRDALQVEVASADTDLMAAGVLDSMAVVTIIAEVEDRLGVELPLDELDIDGFRTLAGIVAFIGAAVGDRGAT